MNNNSTIPVFLPSLDDSTIKHIADVFKVGWLGLGSITKEFEDAIANFLNLENRYVLATNTATSALHLGLRISGIERGDEVITPSFNCVADHQSIKHAGADVVLCDIKEENLGIDCKKAESLITEKTKAIIPLHYSGIPCDQTAVYELAKKHNLRVLEDCCHAFGTALNGKKFGSYGDMAVFSFDPIKVITSVDGGCLVVNDEQELEKLQQMRLLGMDKDTFARYKNKRLWKNYDVVVEGYRYHLSNVLASIGMSQIKKIHEIIKSRQQVCTEYSKAFSNIDDIKILSSTFDEISPFIYVIRILNGKRESLMEHLKSKFIDTAIHWSPAHTFSYFSNARKDDLSITNKISEEILTLPLHSNMKSEYVQRIIEGVQSFFKK